MGYTVVESIQLIDELLKQSSLDYSHISSFTGYDAKPAGYDETYIDMARKVIDNRAKLISVNGSFTADGAMEALKEANLLAIGRAALIEPEFTHKIKSGKADTIRTKVENLEKLNWPKGRYKGYHEDNSPLLALPIEGI